MAASVDEVDSAAASAVVADMAELATAANKAAMVVCPRRLLLPRPTRSPTSRPVVVNEVPSSSSAM